MTGNAATGGPGSPDSGNLSSVRWTDKSFPLTRDRQGINQKPDYDFTNRGLLFPQNDPSEFVQIIDQMDHSKKWHTNADPTDTELRLHIHFVQTSETLIPTFKCAYKYFNNGSPIPVADTVISTDDGPGLVFPWIGEPMIQLIQFPYIFFNDSEAISAHFECDIYRDDNVALGDVLTKFIDYHYAKDSDGSRQEFSK